MHMLPTTRGCCLYVSIMKITPNEEIQRNVVNTHLESRREIKSLFPLLLHIQNELGGFTVHRPVTAVTADRHFVSFRYS